MKSLWKQKTEDVTSLGQGEVRGRVFTLHPSVLFESDTFVKNPASSFSGQGRASPGAVQGALDGVSPPGLRAHRSGQLAASPRPLSAVLALPLPRLTNWEEAGPVL